jgi:AcrR family transcriptional regulator
MTIQDTTRDRLIEAAGEEFAEKGFEVARVRTICERAGANVAAVNYHFGDKEKLYIQVVLEAHRCGIVAADDRRTEGGTPPDQLREFIHHFLSRVLAISHPDDWRHRVLVREMLHPTSASDVLIREAIRPRFEQLTQIMRQFCPDAEDRKIHALSLSVIGQCLHYKMARACTERLIGAEALHALDLDYLTDHISSFCLAALGCRRPLNVPDETDRASVESMHGSDGGGQQWDGSR